MPIPVSAPVTETNQPWVLITTALSIPFHLHIILPTSMLTLRIVIEAKRSGPELPVSSTSWSGPSGISPRFPSAGYALRQELQGLSRKCAVFLRFFGTLSLTKFRFFFSMSNTFGSFSNVCTYQSIRADFALVECRWKGIRPFKLDGILQIFTRGSSPTLDEGIVTSRTGDYPMNPKKSARASNRALRLTHISAGPTLFFSKNIPWEHNFTFLISI